MFLPGASPATARVENRSAGPAAPSTLAGMGTARFATVDDIGEIIRLRQIMLENWIECPDNGWREDTAAVLERRLTEPEPTMAVTVVDVPGAPGVLASCATGVINERLPSPRNRTGRFGWVFNVCTDPQWRRRGFGKACTAALMDWYDQRGIIAVELMSTPAGEDLYRDLGFIRSDEPAMRHFRF